MIPKDTSYKIHQWLIRTLSEKDKNKISAKYPTALKHSVLGIDLDAKIKNIMEVVWEEPTHINNIKSI